jgi:hypothetical protein
MRASTITALAVLPCSREQDFFSFFHTPFMTELHDLSASLAAASLSDDRAIAAAFSRRKADASSSA